jgi:hypothetical protein
VPSVEQDLETIRFYVFAVPGSRRVLTLASISTAESGIISDGAAVAVSAACTLAALASLVAIHRPVL